MPRGAISFELERFGWTGGAPLLEVAGRWRGPRRRRIGAAALVVHTANGPRRVVPSASTGDARAGPEPELWRAEFAWTSGEVERAELEVGPSLVIELPAPPDGAAPGVPPSAPAPPSDIELVRLELSAARRQAQADRAEAERVRLQIAPIRREADEAAALRGKLQEALTAVEAARGETREAREAREAMARAARDAEARDQDRKEEVARSASRGEQALGAAEARAVALTRERDEARADAARLGRERDEARAERETRARPPDPGPPHPSPPGAVKAPATPPRSTAPPPGEEPTLERPVGEEPTREASPLDPDETWSLGPAPPPPFSRSPRRPPPQRPRSAPSSRRWVEPPPARSSGPPAGATTLLVVLLAVAIAVTLLVLVLVLAV